MQVYIYGSCGVEGGEFGGKAAANTHVLASNHERLMYVMYTGISR